MEFHLKDQGGQGSVKLHDPPLSRIGMLNYGIMIVTKVHLDSKLLVQVVSYLKPPRPLGQFYRHMEMIPIHGLLAAGTIIIVAVSLNTCHPVRYSYCKMLPSLYNSAGKTLSGRKLGRVRTTIGYQVHHPLPRVF